MRKKRGYIFPGLYMPEKTAVIISGFIFLTGISAGVFLVFNMDAADKTVASDFIKNYFTYTGPGNIDYPDPFFREMATNLSLLVMILISGMFSFGFLVSHTLLLFKGITIGFSTGIFLENYGTSMFSEMVISILPQNLILIPVVIFSNALAVSWSFSSSKNDRHHLRDSRFILTFILLAAAVTAACVIESLIFNFHRV